MARPAAPRSDDERNPEVDGTARVPPKKVRLKDHSARDRQIKDKKQAVEYLMRGVERLSEQQERLYAQDTYAVLLIFQAMDAAGKDGTIRHVMSGVNPQGCEVYSFKAPSAEERDHTYLWRSMKALPERGRIGIHNRYYYEEVLVVRVHRDILASQQLPDDLKRHGIWKRRFREINDFEQHLYENGTVIIKFFLNVSKEEQKRRFLARIDEEDKNWKFSVADAKERALSEYMKAYEEGSSISTKAAPRTSSCRQQMVQPLRGRRDHLRRWTIEARVPESLGRKRKELKESANSFSPDE
jgi:PPK2 family polyphosphate:nucleotide phosphotransferase